MDPLLLRAFVGQVWGQTVYFFLAWTEHQAALASPNPDEQARVWHCIESMLNATANMSKILWGQKGKKANERQEVRDLLGIADSSPIRDPDMRNNFEHFDERLETWWKDSTDHNYIDMNIGNVHRVLTGFEAIDMFRSYDPTTGDVWFWGDQFNLKAIHAELFALYPRLKAEVQRLYGVIPGTRELPEEGAV